MPRIKMLVILSLLVLLSACTSAPTSVVLSPTNTAPALPAASIDPTPTSPTVDEIAPPTYPEFLGGALSSQRGDLFTGSGNCAFCHTNMTDASGKDVSIDRSWGSSMMGNSSKDPYWLATVRSEVELAPELREAVEQKCATCHMPMAKVTALADGDSTLLLDEGFSSQEHPLFSLAQDGVSCNVCHQIEPDNLGQVDSFSGGFLIDLDLASGKRVSYGPYQLGRQRVNIMQGSSGYIPQLGLHLSQSELCGTCHNLVTPYVDAAGQIAGEFPEQAIYSEWQNSVYPDQAECMDCHMPEADGFLQISTIGGPARGPFSQHTFAGGNEFMLNILRLHGEEIGVTTSSANLAKAAEEAQNLLTEQAASVKLENLQLIDGTLIGQVVIESQVGHKFPGGYPSRRAWLHITVFDSSGNILFESGSASSNRRISGNDNDEDPALYEPHYSILTAPDQVQIYEAILLNSDGEVTTTLLRAAAYAKDNRLLPQGFDSAAATADTQVFGVPAEDSDFSGGGDRIGLEIPLGEQTEVLRVEVELVYQSIGYRWAQNLLLDPSVEAETFGRYYNSIPNLPVVAASAQGTAQP